MHSRRDFIKTTGLATLAVTAHGSLLAGTQNHSSIFPDKGPSIRKISIFAAGGSFYRFIGPNAYDERPKGIKGNPRKIVLTELSDGTQGIGTLGYRPLTEEVLKTVKTLIGRDIFSLYTWSGETISGVSREMEALFFDATYAWVESALLDAIGRLRQAPVWKLFGSSVRNSIDPYDGTMYFEDIASQTDVQIIAKIAKRIKSDGYRAIKIKLGRPDKWLPGDAGVMRDIEAFIALREAVGNNFNLMADANNGYRDKFEQAVKMLKACAPYNMYFIEELFP
ncbi:MAG: enolase C-terminal domain-like protein, partial [Bacteroidia bacterium]